MLRKRCFDPKIFISASVFLLTSCANVIHNIVESSVQTVADSIQGYRVQFHSIPAGARIMCLGEELGEAPFHKYYALTPEQKEKQVLEIDNCHALWPSGALADIKAAIPLEQYPRYVQLATERPTDTPGYVTDEAFGERTLALRQKAIDDADEAARSLVSLGFGIYQVTRASKYTSTQLYNTHLRSISSSGGIRWNWVQAPPLPMQMRQPSFGIQSTIPNRNLTPVYPASSCVGVIVAGRCEGTIVDASVSTVCAGSFVNGRCLGSVLFGQ